MLQTAMKQNWTRKQPIWRLNLYSDCKHVCILNRKFYFKQAFYTTQKDVFLNFNHFPSHRAPESFNFVHWKFVKLRGLLWMMDQKKPLRKGILYKSVTLFEQLTNTKACSELWSLFAVDKHFLCPFSNLPIFRLGWRWCASLATHMRTLVMMTTTMLLLSSIQYLIFEGTGCDLDSF